MSIDKRERKCNAIFITKRCFPCLIDFPDLRVRPKLEKIRLQETFTSNVFSSITDGSSQTGENHTAQKPLPPMSFPRLLMGRGKKDSGRDEVADFSSSSRRDRNFVQFHLWREG
ncbi:hypothetical protein CEXT_162161 [Caerostris extrusa]|uniref:Uncharacterized protein n=1 Tax=Caerostris extrusa TaxID=172846 RepID=A0AAV4Q106_CAEEX|nr:hypothetical protein CEXT_162161 [Caerostris extrusa]